MFLPRYISIAIVILHSVKALGRHKMMAKQHETPLFFIDEILNTLLYSTDLMMHVFELHKYLHSPKNVHLKASL